MVCEKCEKKLKSLVVPEPFKDGIRNGAKTAGETRKINQNKLLQQHTKKARLEPYAKKCKLCKGAIHQAGGTFCQGCSYKNGICGMCGVKILDTKGYRQTNK